MTNRTSLSAKIAWHKAVTHYQFHKLECVWFVPMANQIGLRYENLRCECGNTYNQHDAVKKVKHLSFKERARVRKRLTDKNVREIVCIKTSHWVARPQMDSPKITHSRQPSKRSRAATDVKSTSVFYTDATITKLRKIVRENQSDTASLDHDDESLKLQIMNRATILRDVTKHDTTLRRSGSSQCYCHSIVTKLPEPVIPWSEDKAFEMSPTDCYGKINFRYEHRKPAKYIRLAAQDDNDEVFNFVTSEWGLMEPRKPELVLNICGPLKVFQMHKKTKTRLHDAIIKVSENTSAWLITSGLKMGVTKFIGQAVQDGQTYSVIDGIASHNIKCIGLTPWGKVANKHLLQLKTSQDFAQETAQVYEVGYKIYQTSSHDYQPVPLDPNHTHFILVDNGYRNRFTGPGSITKFQFAFLGTLKCNGLNTVTVVIGGGAHVLFEVRESMAVGVPVVICEGTNRAADLLAGAYRHADENGELKEDYVKTRLRYQVEWLKSPSVWESEEEKLRCIDIVLQCCREKNMMTLFDVRKHDDLEEAILGAFVKAQGDTNKILELAYACNQADFAETELLKDTQHMPLRRLNNLLHQSLIDDRCDFVRLLLRDHVDLSKVLKRSTLLKLYNFVLQQHQADHILRMLQRSKHSSLTADTAQTVKMVNMSEVGSSSKVKLIYDLHDIGHIVLSRLISVYDKKVYTDENSEERLEQPNRELFIWSILVNRYFENMAKETLDLMNNKYPDQAAEILSENLTRYNGLTCMQVAAGAHDLDFISAKACQCHMRYKWRAGIKCTIKKLLLCFVCPIFIWSSFNTESVERMKKSAGNFASLAAMALWMFYTSPIIKYVSYTVTFVMFLLIYTAMVLFPVNSQVTYLHYVVMVWVFSYICDEVHRIVLYPIPSLRWKLFGVMGVMRALCLLSPISCFIAFGFHCVYGYLPYIKLFYSINMVLFYLTVLRLYTPSEYLGPKLLIIKQTLVPLTHFFMILFVYSLSYGVASFATMYPKVEPTAAHTVSEAFHQVIMAPYWHIYGELSLDNINNDEVCYAQHNISAVNISSSLGLPCRTHSYVVIVMLAVYLFFGNILLLNLIIAIFSQIFTNIQIKSSNYWRFLMYTFITEYEVKSVLPPPLCVIEYIIRIVIYFCCPSPPKQTERDKDKECVLRWVEEEMNRHYIRQQHQDSNMQVFNVYTNIKERMDDLASNLKKVEKLVVEIGGTEVQLQDIKEAISNITLPETVTNDQTEHVTPKFRRRKSKFPSEKSPAMPPKIPEKIHSFRETVSLIFLKKKKSANVEAVAEDNIGYTRSSGSFNTLYSEDDLTSSDSGGDEPTVPSVWYNPEDNNDIAETSFIEGDTDSMSNLLVDDSVDDTDGGT